MIYFIPNWKQQDQNWEKERALGLIKLFLENKLEHQLISINYMPFLRYKVQEYGILSQHYWRVYDVLQNIQIKTGHPLSIHDLELPEDTEIIYYPFRILLLQDGKKYGEVFFNQYGWMEKVTYYQTEGSYVDHYDDRGFLSSRQFLNDEGVTVQQQFFNEQGKRTLTQYFGAQSRIVIEADGNHTLAKKEYDKMEEVIDEILNHFLIGFDNQKDDLLVEFDDATYQAIKCLPEHIQAIQMISDDDQLTNLTSDEILARLKNSKIIVTDTTSKEHELHQLIVQHSELSEKRIQKIPMYNVQLALGISNSIPQLIIYTKIMTLTEDNLLIHEYLIRELIENQKYGLVLHVEYHHDQESLLRIQKKIIDEHFGVDRESDDYKKVERYVVAKNSRTLFDSDEKAIEHLRGTSKWKDFVEAVDVYQRIAFCVAPPISEIKAELNKARIFIDLNEAYDLQVQSFAVSAGIPLILSQETDYLLDQKNGCKINSVEEFSSAIDLYLNDLSHWNQSLVESVAIIEDYNPDRVAEKWRGLFSGEKANQSYSH